MSSSPRDASDDHGPDWQERFHGGSPEAEQAHFQQLARNIVAVQRSNTRNSSDSIARRTFHAKIVVGVDDAELVMRSDVPDALCPAHLSGGARFPTTVRLSNASGSVRSDALRDLRGAALKITLPDGAKHDLLMTSYPVSHARDADQFVRVAVIGSGPRAAVLPRMIAAFGLRETRRIVSNLRAANRPSSSLAAESYWSRGALLWGDTPARLRLSPRQTRLEARGEPTQTPDGLEAEFAHRLRRGPVGFVLSAQPYVSEAQTPLEDGAVEWPDEVSPFVEIADLVIPAQEITSSEGRAVRDSVDRLAFSPWHCPPEFRPLGNLNRARQPVYQASATAWQGRAVADDQEEQERPMASPPKSMP